MLSDFCVTSGRLIAEALAGPVGTVPDKARLVFAVQVRRETANGTSLGALKNNPLNLTTAGGRIVWPGQTGTYPGGNSDEWHVDFAAFGTLEAGARACAANYASDTYADVQRAFRSGDPIALAEAIQASPWDSGHYGGTLVDEVRAEFGQEVDVTDEEFLEKLHRLYTPNLQKQLDQTVYAPLADTKRDIADLRTAYGKHGHKTSGPTP